MASQLCRNIIFPLLIGLSARVLEYLRVLHRPKWVLLAIWYETRINHWHAAITVLSLLHSLSEVAATHIIVWVIHSCGSLLILIITIKQCISCRVDGSGPHAPIICLIIGWVWKRLPFNWDLMKLHKLVWTLRSSITGGVWVGWSVS